MGQLSFFAADVADPTLDGLGGLLAAHGQITRNADGSRLSILLLDAWRADAIRAEFDRRAVNSSVRRGSAPDPDPQARAAGATVPSFLVRSERSAELDALAAAWTRGAVKTAAAFPTPPGGLLRCWALAAGRADPSGYLLGTDPHAGHTYPRLAASLSAIGLTAAVLGSRGGGPGMRIVGRRRLDRLAELLGEPPVGAPPDAFPTGR
ncbi:hypothetical protein [Nakamurella lactea]|uniref:hypothetical protein n=1 Tax=Nakamurella lactea TaxID=459515 RepID=UPI0003FD8102|nr:hypothetical protein [Nakamurella lactea]